MVYLIYLSEIEFMDGRLVVFRRKYSWLKIEFPWPLLKISTIFYHSDTSNFIIDRPTFFDRDISFKIGMIEKITNVI